MSQHPYDPLQHLCRRHQPAGLRVQMASGEQRELKPSGTGARRWRAVLDALERLDWHTLELIDGKGALLGVYDNPAVEAAPEPASDDALDRMLQRMTAAQREALTWQDKGVRAALDTCVAVMRELSTAVSTLSRVHQMQLEAAMQLSAETGEALPGAKLLEQMAPMLAAKMMAPNGAKKPG